MGDPKLVLLLACGLMVLYVQAAPQSNILAMQAAQNAANSNGPPGQPQFSINGGGTGNDKRNFNAGGNANLGTKLFESSNQRHSVGAGVSAGQSFGRYQGHSYRSKPDVGVGAAYTYRFRG